ncbi:MAG: hypothetical protein QOF73_946, partial [Thermomicrobiales bacterium]|nr:hypothetical protein [Thermomicrobiales bacterium]
MAGVDPSQLVIDEIFLKPVATEVAHESATFNRRPTESVGRLAKSRHVMSNQWIVAGTRIPTAAIWSFHEAGYDTDAITIESRPDPLDVQRAIQ